MQDTRRRRDHDLEMAAPNGRTRNPSPRTNLSLPGDARCGDASPVRIDLGTSEGSQLFRVGRYCSARSITSAAQKQPATGQAHILLHKRFRANMKAIIAASAIRLL